MPDPSPDPTTPKSPGGIHVGDLTSERDVNVTLTDVAGGDQIKITNSPGATVIKEAPRKLSREEQLAQRNRQTMLLKVKAYWIDGVLANSLHSKVITLDMERKPDAVTRPRPWDMLWQHRDQRPQPLPAGTKIGGLFNYAAGDALLILGEPGSGKTTMLLELAGELLEWAEQNETLRIPVVFNLSSWAVLRPPLTEWLVSELQTLYLIPKQVAQTWVEQDDILPLLDGLDEVAQEHRAACIKAINTYREAQGTPLVVCSRIADYEAIGEKLLLSDALLLRPLTQEQINEYLAAGGPALDSVRQVLQHDETLQEMAQSPLLLSMMALTYRDQPPEQVTTTAISSRRQIFTAYIRHQLAQRKKEPTEDTATTLYQLAYLAYEMNIHNQPLFLVERIQLDWIPVYRQILACLLTLRLVYGLIGGLFLGGILGMGSGLILRLFLGAIGFVIGFLSGTEWNMDDIKPVEKASWSWKRITLWHVVSGLIAGPVFGLLLVLFSGTNIELNVGLIIGLVLGLVMVLSRGLGSELVEFKTIPNEGIRNSLPKALRVGLISGLSIGLIGGTFAGLIGALVVGLVSGARFVTLVTGTTGGIIIGAVVGLVIGFESGLLFGLSAGAIPVIKHYILRFWFYRYGYLPLKLVPFLDLATERLILQKVGGGYRFVHRLLQEYLASLYEEEGVNSVEL